MSSQRERAMKPTDLRGILRYVPMFRDHVFVIAVDGSIVSHENFANIVTDIAVLRSLSIKVVLVHGIGQQLVGLAGEHNIALSDIQGEGPTDVSTMSLAREASALVSQSVLENLSQAGLRCAITNAVRSTKIGRLKGVDHLYTGKVEKVDAAILKSMLSQDILPLVTPIVCDREGQSLRVNSDHLAMELAVALGASKLIYLTPFSGLQVDGVVQLNLPEDELKRLLADKHAKLDPRIRSKAVQAAKALDEDVPRAHILKRQLRKDRNAVVSLLSPRNHVRVAKRAELIDRDLVHRALAFLKTQDVGGLFRHQARHQPLAQANGVDVPCGKGEGHRGAPGSRDGRP